MSIPRREFLKSASIAAGAAAVAATMRDAGAQTPKPAREVRISSEPYTPVRDYPIRGVRYSDVRLTDDFWKPKVDLNAAVTIPILDRARQRAQLAQIERVILLVELVVEQA